MTDSEDRIFPLDVVRGAAIIGVVLMNVVAIALPRVVTVMPSAGDGGLADRIVWLAGFVLVDGKARALLAMLFGASTLLVIDRAEMDGRDGMAAQRRRLLWLLPIGIAHHMLLWSGDILVLLAIAGLISLRFAGSEPIDLLKAAFVLFAAQLVIVGLLGALPYGAPAADYATLVQREMVHDIALHRDSYLAQLEYRLINVPRDALLLCLYAMPETLGFMTLGMAMAKGGFFSGHWTREQYLATARRAYPVGCLPLLALGLWVLSSSDARHADLVAYALSFPLRIPVAIAHAALFAWIAVQYPDAPMLRRLAEVGRTALSNYLIASLIVTSIAFGYGLGLYARLDRVALLALSILLAMLMLFWSPLWLRRFGRGPAERLWRALQRR